MAISFSYKISSEITSDIRGVNSMIYDVRVKTAKPY